MRHLVAACWAVSTSPPMPRWADYVRYVQSQSSPVENSRGDALRSELCRMVLRRRPSIGDLCSTEALLASLVSFTDDCDRKAVFSGRSMPPTGSESPRVPPMTLRASLRSKVRLVHEPARDAFAVPVALRLLEALPRAGALTVPDQLELALDLASNDLFQALLALHTTTRVLARGRDTCLHPAFALTLEERLSLGEGIAPFHPDDARGGDPLGDTYHFWANVIGGMYSVRNPGAGGVLVRSALYAGPVLMRVVRQEVFGSRLFCGDHARIDRLGLSIGRAIGVASMRRSSSRVHGVASRAAADSLHAEPSQDA
ncbi:MAG: hypothetical protein AAGE52_29265 [Myxococcota bacterium]